MHKVIISGYDDEANEKSLAITVCYEKELDGTRTITFEDYDITVDIKDLEAAITYLRNR